MKCNLSNQAENYFRSLQIFVIRPGLYLALSFLFAFALAQSLGRLGANFIGHFEPAINEGLAPLNARAFGVSASWRGINPLVTFDRLEFAAGAIDELELELDFAQTLLLGTWVPALLTWDQFRLHLDQVDDGWELRNLGDAELPFDADAVVRYGSRIFGDLELVLTPMDSQPKSYRFDLDLARDRDRRFAYLSVHLLGSGLRPLALGYTGTGSGSGGAPRTQEYFAGGELLIPGGILSDGDLFLSVRDGYLNAAEGFKSTGSTKVSVAASNSALVIDRLGAGFRIDVAAFDENIVGAITEIEVFNTSSKLALADALFQLDFARPKEIMAEKGFLPNLRIWSAAVELGPLSELLVESVHPAHKMYEWLSALSLSGEARDLHLFANADGAHGFAVDIDNIEMQGYRGVPSVQNAKARLWGDIGHIGLLVDARDITIEFPDLFTDAWVVDEAQGAMTLVVRPNYLGLRGENVIARRGQSLIAGSFATTRPLAKYEQRVALQVAVDASNLQDARSYIPFKLSPRLYSWLTTAPEQGQFNNVELALQGQIHLKPERKFDRRLELVGDFSNVQLRYLSDWPIISNAAGELKLSGPNTRVELQRGDSGGIAIAQAVVAIDRPGLISVNFEAQSSAQEALDFIRASPLKSQLKFIEDDWRANGKGLIDAGFYLEIPLASNTLNLDDSGNTELIANLDLNISDVSLQMPAYRLSVANVNGQATFSLPHHFEGQLQASMFGRPAVIKSFSSDEWLNIEVDGRIDAAQALALTAVDAPNVVKGETAFSSRLNLAMAGDVSNLVVLTDLVGMGVNLPAEFGKTLSAKDESEFVLKFLSKGPRLDWKYKTTQGWLMLPPKNANLPIVDDIIASVGISVAAPTLNSEHQKRRGVKVTGQMPFLDVEDWISEDGQAVVDLPFNWHLVDLKIDDLAITEFNIANVELGGHRTGEELIFSLQAADVVGQLDLTDSETLKVDLSLLRLPLVNPVGQERDAFVDPMTIELGKALPRAKFSVENLYLGEEPFGRWSVDIQPRGNAVDFDIDAIDLKGLHVREAFASWDFTTNSSTFAGQVDLDNLLTTLPQWGYVPAIETEFARASGKLSWPGSPANLNIIDSDGGFNVLAKNGSFLDVDTGQRGLRIVSLLNISALTKRINLDFSDIVGEGISFDRVGAEIKLENQILSFNKNLIVESTSSTYELGGTVDFRRGSLNNEMIVTLPVSESLPWYAAFLALANPLAGLGVALGEQILRKPIQRMSSAKFSVTGSIDDPDVRFLTLWGESIEANPAAIENSSADLAE